MLSSAEYYLDTILDCYVVSMISHCTSNQAYADTDWRCKHILINKWRYFLLCLHTMLCFLPACPHQPPFIHPSVQHVADFANWQSHISSHCTREIKLRMTTLPAGASRPLLWLELRHGNSQVSLHGNARDVGHVFCRREVMQILCLLYPCSSASCFCMRVCVFVCVCVC